MEPGKQKESRQIDKKIKEAVLSQFSFFNVQGKIKKGKDEQKKVGNE